MRVAVWVAVRVGYISAGSSAGRRQDHSAGK